MGHIGQSDWRNLIVIGSACLAGALFAAHAAGADGPKLSPAETRAVYKAAGLMQKQGNWVNSCGEPAPDKTEVVDLNGKGKAGVFLYVTGSCLHWEGSRFKMYVKGRDGRWEDALGVAATKYSLLAAKHKAHYDVEVINEGASANAPDSIYCWNGQRYVNASLNRCGR